MAVQPASTHPVSTPPAGPHPGIGLGPQGGDPRSQHYPVAVDLSTCVCAYGPPPTALRALHETPAAVLQRHPYTAASDLCDAYSAYLGVPAGCLAAARGASELIWQLGSGPLASRVVVPLPAYTEYRQAFPGAAVLAPAGEHHSLSAIGAALADGKVVLISNPHNPSGRAFERDELCRVARANPGGVLVVDESYVEFCAEPQRWTLVGCDVANVAVLRSPSKFFGLAGARVGVAWSPSTALRDAFVPQRGSWPVSAIEVAPVAAALADRAWADAVRTRLRADASWLDGVLRAVGCPVPGAVTHFRLVCCPDAAAVADALGRCGVAVRLLGDGHGLSGPALRVTAPPAHSRDIVADALRSLGPSVVGRDAVARPV